MTDQEPTQIQRRLDQAKLGGGHIALAGLCALGLTIDLAEMVLGAALGAVHSTQPYESSANELALLLAAPYLGGIVGAPLLGFLADRYGRRGVLSLILILLAATSALAAASKNIAELSLWRGLSGVALGAFPPVMFAFLADNMPAHRRGIVLLSVSAVSTLGAPAIILFVRALSDAPLMNFEGWRVGLLVLSVLSLVAGAAYWGLPESPRWLAARNKMREAQSALNKLIGKGALVAEPAEDRPTPIAQVLSRGSQAALVGLFFLSPWATVAFPILSGAVLVHKGFDVSSSLLFVGVASFGPFVGTIAAAPIIDGIGRRLALAGSAAVMAGTSVAFIFAQSAGLLIPIGLAFTAAASIYVPTLSLYAAELFSTGARARASGAMWAANRFGAAAAPLALVPLMATHGPAGALTVMVAALLCGLALLIASPIGLAKKPLA